MEDPRRIWEDNINMNLQDMFEILFLVNVWKTYILFAEVVVTRSIAIQGENSMQLHTRQ